MTFCVNAVFSTWITQVKRCLPACNIFPFTWNYTKCKTFQITIIYYCKNYTLYDIPIFCIISHSVIDTWFFHYVPTSCTVTCNKVIAAAVTSQDCWHVVGKEWRWVSTICPFTPVILVTAANSHPRAAKFQLQWCSIKVCFHLTDTANIPQCNYILMALFRLWDDTN